MKQRLLSILFLLAAGTSLAQGSGISFYFSAHPDDWQLFMGATAFQDIAGGSAKVVFIYTTAGEANCYNLGVDSTYYLARQDGANRSIQFCADIYSPHQAWSSSVVTMSGLTNHNLLKMTYKNVVSYFLRLPDGCFEKSRCTITKLADKTIPTITAVDNSTTYQGYKDLVETVKSIVEYESSTLQQPTVSIRASDWDPEINPGDHPDHVQTGRLATDVAARVDYANVALYEGYNTCNEPSNLSPEETAMEAALQSQVSFGLTHSGMNGEWDPGSECGHVDWTSRNYFRQYTTVARTKTTSNMLTVNPNPTGSAINIKYKVTESGPVNIVLYDLFGSIKATIINDNEDPGVYTVNYDGETLAPGNYFVSAKTQGHSNTLKFTKL
jgi:hypothetical protein